ncbi:MAG: acyltransferase family protein [Pseudomonadota bacterium]
MSENRHADRLTELDSLRGLAALGVLFYHFFCRYPPPALSKQELHINLFGYFPMPEWYLGLIPVYLFFMISGFVIFITAERCRTVAEFAYRRFSRLYPVYWGALMLLSVVTLLDPAQNDVTLKQFLVNLTMLQAYFGVHHISGVFWSLSVELSFYFMIAGMIRFGLMTHYKYVMLLWSVLTFIYGFFPAPNPVPWPIVWLLALDYGHCFVFGICVYELRRSRMAGIVKIDWMLILLMALSAASNLLRYPATVIVILTILQAAFYFAATRPVAILQNRALVYIGGISYALYLVHEQLGIFVMNMLALPRLAEIAVAFGVALLAAAALTSRVERPSTNWLRIHRPAWTR